VSATKPLYPNPAFDQVNVWYEGFGDAGNLTIYSQDGRVALRTQLAGDQDDHAVDVSQLQDGMYFLRITSDGEAISEQRFVKSIDR